MRPPYWSAALIARVAHEANREWCGLNCDPVPAPWDELDGEMRASVIDGVTWRQGNLDAPVAAQHARWAEYRRSQGWTFGPVKDAANKTHPNLVPYERLPVIQRLKDSLFVHIVRAFEEVHVDGDGRWNDLP